MDGFRFHEETTAPGGGELLWGNAAFAFGAVLHEMATGQKAFSGKSQASLIASILEHDPPSISAVQPTRETMLPYYGVVGGRRVARRTDLYEVETVVEKPTPTEAEQSLIVPGLRAGHYLCFFGIHVFTPAVLDLLGEMIESAPPGATVQLSPALARLAGRERYLALQVEGRRYNIGVKYGLLLAQLALRPRDRDAARVDRDDHAGGNFDGPFTNTRHVPLPDVAEDFAADALRFGGAAQHQDLHEYRVEAASRTDPALHDAVVKAEGVIHDHTVMVDKLARAKGIPVPSHGKHPAPAPSSSTDSQTASKTPS